MRQSLNREWAQRRHLCPLFLIVLAFATAESDTISDTSAVRLVAEQIGWRPLAGVIAGAARAAAMLLAGRASNRGAWLQSSR